jgi:hypothetical protein
MKIVPPNVKKVNRQIKDKNGEIIALGDMLRFNDGRYNQALGIVIWFSTVVENGIGVKICGGGGMGQRAIIASKAEKITKLEDSES